MVANPLQSSKFVRDDHVKRRLTLVRTFCATSGVVFLLLTVLSVLSEQYHPEVAAGMAASGLTFALLTNWWRAKTKAVLIIALNSALLLAYLWSLDEGIRVTIRVNPHGYVATVGSNVSHLRLPGRPGPVGLYAGKISQYNVGPTGEGQAVSLVGPFSALGQWMRFAGPGAAWSDISVTAGSHQFRGRIFKDISRNRRGEVHLAPGSYTPVTATERVPFTFSATLQRADGFQGVLLGNGGIHRGYLFVVRMDQMEQSPDPEHNWVRNSGWYRWDGGRLTWIQSDYLPNLGTYSMLQRDTRLTLGSAMIAIALLVLFAFFNALIPLLRTRAAHKPFEVIHARHRERKFDILALILVLASVLFSSVASVFVLKSMPHISDEVAYYFQAQTYATGHLWVAPSGLPKFFAQQFLLIYHNHWFSKYPPGWPFFLTIGFIFHAPWIVNPLFGGGDVALAYLLGREVYSARVGAFAATLMFSSPWFIFQSASFMSHTSDLFFLSLFAYLIIRWVKRADKKGSTPITGLWQIGIAGAAMGIAFDTRQFDVIAFALPLVCMAIPLLVRKRFPDLALLAFGASVPMLGLAIYNWVITGSPFRSPYTMYWRFDHLGFGPSAGPFGFTPAQGLWNASLNIQYLQSMLFGWPSYLGLAAALIPFLSGRVNRWDICFATSAFLICAGYVAYFHPGIAYGPRYYFDALPWFSLLAARGVQELTRGAPMALVRRGRRTLRFTIPALLVTTCFAYDLIQALPSEAREYYGYGSISPISTQAVRFARIHHGLIFVDAKSRDDWYAYTEVFSANSPLLVGDNIYARDLGLQDRWLMKLYPRRSYYRLVHVDPNLVYHHWLTSRSQPLNDPFGAVQIVPIAANRLARSGAPSLLRQSSADWRAPKRALFINE